MARLACSRATPKLRTARNTAKGRAVFCRSAIARGELVAVWGGVILALEQALELSPQDMTQCIQIEDSYVLWTARHRQTAADWINHSCNPNCGISGQISVVAMRDIAPGEEICFDYAMSSSCLMDEFDCACNAVNCRGHVGADDWQRPDLQERYRGFFSSFLARKMPGLRSFDHDLRRYGV
jgi:hypothetical protein